MTEAQPTPAGVLIVDKPVGPTSMAVCRIVRAKLVRGGAPRRIKVGHGGTLDPYASGVMVVLVGRATKLCDRIMAGEKRYLADIDLGHVSPTDDMEAEPVAVPAEAPGRARVEEVVAGFIGAIQQAPPAHSAMMIGGRRAYELARAGKLTTMEARPVVVHGIEVLQYRFPRLVLDVRCGKGVYIRSLARDVGVALGTGGMLGGLRRTEVAPYTEAESTPLHALPAKLTQADLLDTGSD